MSGFNQLPPYFHNDDYAKQQFYHELFNRTLRDWFRTDIGFFLPGLTDANIADIFSLTTVPTQRVWINIDSSSAAYNKIQFIDSLGVLQTVTST